MTPRVFREWQNRVAAEYRSAAITAQTLHWAIQVGLPDPLLSTALRIVRDELDHAALSHDCLVALGGQDDPEPVEMASLALPTQDNPVAALVDSVGQNFCLGETFAVPLFNAMYQHTTHEAARPVLTRVLQDEAIHRAFGWDALDALLEIDAAGVRGRIEAQLDRWLGGFERSYALGADETPLSDEERAAGLMDASQYTEVFWHTVRTDISPRFARRGFSVPERFV